MLCQRPKASWSQIRDDRHSPHLGTATTPHIHLHCIVAGGGLTKEGKWKTAKNKGKFLFPVKAMSKVFRIKYVKPLKSRLQPAKELVDELYQKN
ncbi:transposase [Algoriphagus sp. C2-6-M1]|uniref:transposase n=1 Tax=Algoriphagus persicinus TaxID=3108754 RepID=UPI003A5CAB73